MKAITTLSTIALVSLSIMQSKAQTFEIKGGLNLSKMNISYSDGLGYLISDYSIKTKFQPGLHIGALIDFPLNETFSIETGLILSTGGFKLKSKDDYEEENEKYEFESTINLNTYNIHIPLSFKATKELNSNLNLYGNVGPYIGIGIFGFAKTKFYSRSQYTFEGNTDVYTENEEFSDELLFGPDISENSNYRDLNRLDFGLTFGGGVELNAFTFGASYDFGLRNISTHDNYDESIKNRNLKISFGYLFGR